MKSAGILALLCAACFNAVADDVALSGNPYESVVERNIFDLVPIPTNNPANDKPPDPPSKITPNGIMSLFGELQVLFKVAVPPRPGQPPHEQSYTMSVGERQDDIEVTKIDESAGMITFNNHGVIQELSLTKAVAASAAPQRTIPATGFRPPGLNRFRQRQNPNEGQSFGGNDFHSTAAHAYGNNSLASGNDSVPNYGSAPTAYGNNGNNNSQAQQQLSPEAQALLIEQNYMNAKANNDPSAPLFPPTPLRAQSDAAVDGGTPAPPAP